MSIASPGHRLYLYAYLWLLLPALLFLGGWIRPVVAIPVGLLLCYGVWHSMVTLTPREYRPLRWNHRLAWSLALLTAWVSLSGLGGLMWQDYWDHGFRNGVYFDLVNRTWPVTAIDNGHPSLFCYYFGFWLPSALVAKLTGSLEAGYWVQFLYGLAGCVLVLLMIFRHIGAVKVRVVVILALFCGWDIVAWLILADDVNLYAAAFELKDLCYQGFSSPSATTQLYFIYNQGIAFWITAMLLLRQRDNAGALILTYSLLAIFSPITAAATAPVVIYGCLRQWRRALTVANGAGILFGLIVMAFYMANSRVGGFGINDWGTLPVFLLFLLCSYGVFMPFVWHRFRHDPVFYILAITMIALSWTQLGSTGDMAWRCTIPLSFYLMLALMQESVAVKRWRQARPLAMACVLGSVAVKRWRQARPLAMACVLGIGMLAPLGILARSAGHQLQYWRGILHTTRSEGYSTLFMDTICHDNFIASGESFYTRYLMRDRDNTVFATKPQ